MYLVFISICFLVYGINIHASKKQELIQFAREMGSKKIRYAARWTPPGEKDVWVMDCSNTVRYTYKKVYSIELPRTSRSQYSLAVRQGKFIKAPTTSNGKVDSDQLRKDLRIGDILFWIDTYNVKEQPPISHVMIYVGKNSNGTMKMFGAGTFGKGEQTNNGGLDVYVFDPNQKLGCVRDNSGKCIRDSQFIGYARMQI